MFKDKSILITGAAGTIGKALAVYLSQFKPNKLIFLDNAETPLYNLEKKIKYSKIKDTKVYYILGSINNSKLINNILLKNNVDIIFHAAAYKHVPMVENNPIPGVVVNIFGTINLAKLAIIHDVSNFIFISTDKAVKPSSVMGATKKIAENYILGLSTNTTNKTKFIITRFGNVINSNGSIIPLFKSQLKKGLPVTVTDKKATRYFIGIDEVVELLHKSLQIGDNGTVFSFDMKKAINIYNLAKETITKSKYNDQVIKIIGLRAGEKIHEDLLDDYSILLKTKHSRVFKVATKETINFKELVGQLNQLSIYVTNYNELATVKQLKVICKSYKSLNSKYSELD